MQSIAIKTISKKLIGYLLTSILLSTLISCTSLKLPEKRSNNTNDKQEKLNQENYKKKQPNFNISYKTIPIAKEALQNSLDILDFRFIKQLTDNDLNQLIIQIPHNAEKILALLGYFNPIISVEKSVASDGIPLIELTVDVGPPNKVNNVSLELTGDIIFDNSAEISDLKHQIYEAWPLHSESFFTQDNWSKAKSEALKILLSSYFPDAKIIKSNAKINVKNNSSDILIRYDSGARYKIGKINVNGITRYNPQLVKNIMQLKEGQLYEYDAIIEAQNNLTNSGYFDSANLYLDNKDIVMDKDNKTKIANLEVNLTEYQYKRIVASVGFTTDSGPRLGLEFNHNQLPLFNLRNSIKLELNKKQQNIDLSFATPLNKNNWYWILRDKFQHEKLLDFKSHTQNEISLGKVKQSRPYDNGIYLTRSKSWDYTTDNELIKSSAISLKHKVVVRNFDNYVNPKAGWATSVDYGIGLSRYNSKNYPFLRIDTNALGFFQISKTAGRILANTGIGAVIAQKNAIIPSSELFYAGGINSVRGYKYRSLGIFNPQDDKYYPARNIYSLSLEWQKPIFIKDTYSNWDSTVFIDSVNLSNSFKFNNQWYNGVGAGLIWTSPVGSLQISIARAIQHKEFRFHLALGYTF